MCNARQSAAASRSASVIKHEMDMYDHGGQVDNSYRGGPEGGHRLFEVPFCEYAMEGKSAAASRSNHVSKHQIHTILDGERVKSGSRRGAGVSSSV